ncbi:MAG: hypothetical protein IPG51_04920 [Chloroflexi bacterium]|nr:hypothetical protein [Chloroflexota bacterium]
MNPKTALVSVHDCSIALNGAYIYVIYAPQFNCIYVGQTRGNYGAMGRLAQHISDSYGNTFKQKVQRYFDLEEPILGHLEFAAYRLPERQEFLSAATDFREAIEYLIQKNLILMTSRIQMKVGCVSRVKSNAYQKQDFIKAEGEIASEFFFQWLSSIVDKTQNSL